MAKKRRFRIRDVNAVRQPGELSATADGKLAAMSVAELAPDGGRMISRVWLLDEAAREGARPITAEGKRASLPKFSSDGRRLAYLAEGDKEKMQLVVLSAPFSEPKVLTSFEHGVKWFDWLGGRRLLVLAAADRFELLARVPLGEASFATPAIADGVMYLRTYKHLISVGGKRP